ncbi:hypothetical protein C8R46DRAFT_1120735 [Mycena filopes]|nr:hypothetical protein C8R46DRAFT_1120735 [Mycena filopes]
MSSPLPELNSATEAASRQGTSGETTTIHSIPPEVLSKIFHNITSDDTWVRPRISEAPLLVCNVSSHWRHTALASPELWDNLVVTFRDPTRTAWRMDMAKAWLARARSRKISLWIFFFHMISANPIGELVAPLERQIAVLQLTSAPIGCLQGLIDFPAGSLPLLRTLTVAYPPPHFSWARKAHADRSTQIFRQLEDFTISAGWSVVVLDVKQLPINWAQLTTLRIEKAGTPLSALCALLAQCTALISCDLTIQTITEAGDPPPPSPDGPTVLSHLTDLSLRLTQGFDHFLARFRFPALATLTLGTNMMAARTPVARSLPLLASPTLRRLTTDMYVELTALLGLLEGSPAIDDLNLLFDAEVVRALAQGEQLIPRLSALTLVLGDAEADTLALIGAVVQMRGCLQRLTVWPVLGLWEPGLLEGLCHVNEVELRVEAGKQWG